jgi:glycosyltransferase involved in cell wall biosynthesis
VAKSKKLLVVCSYYHPYVSGLTIIATKVAEDMVKQGYLVDVLCQKHEKLPSFEVVNGVNVHRATRILSLNRATFSINFFLKFWRLASSGTIVNLHLPLPEAGVLAAINRGKCVSTYQCDVDNGGIFMRYTAKLIDFSSALAMKRSSCVIFTSHDYAESSRLHKDAREKLCIIPNFIDPQSKGSPTYRSGEGKHFGFLGRFTSEKGISVLVDAFARIQDPEARLLLAGSSNLVGDSILPEIVEKIRSDARVRLLLDISEYEKANFFSSIDVLCFPSTNSFEAFGIVQIEALLSGVPVIASNLPGVRTIVSEKEYGVIVEPGSVDALFEAMLLPGPRRPSPSEIDVIASEFSSRKVLGQYGELFNKIFEQ